MDGGLVSDETAGESIPRLAYTTKFYEVFPYYLAIGMTYEQFWEQDCELVKYYNKAAKIKRDMENQQAWLQGAYVYEAIGNLVPVLGFNMKKGAKATPYRSEPFPLSKEKVEEKQQKQQDKAKTYMEMFMIMNNKRFEKKGVQDGG